MADDATSRARSTLVLQSDLSRNHIEEALLCLVGNGFQIIDTRTHAAIPREPSDADVERVARAMFRADAWYGTKSPNEAIVTMTDGEVPGWKIFAAKARAAIAALVQGQTQGGEDGDV